MNTPPSGSPTLQGTTHTPPPWLDTQRPDAVTRAFELVEALPTDSSAHIEALCDAWEGIERQLYDAEAMLRLRDAGDLRAIAYRLQLDRLLQLTRPRADIHRARLLARLESLAHTHQLPAQLRPILDAQRELLPRRSPTTRALLADVEVALRSWATTSAETAAARLHWERHRTSPHLDARRNAHDALRRAQDDAHPTLEQTWLKLATLRLKLAHLCGEPDPEAHAAHLARRHELHAASASFCELVRFHIRPQLADTGLPDPWARDRAWGAPEHTPDIQSLAADALSALEHIGGKPLAAHGADVLRRADLATRPHKALGAMTLIRPLTQRAAIFIHPLGSFEDGPTLLHELGHALQLQSHSPRWRCLGPPLPLAAQEACAIATEHLLCRHLATHSPQHRTYWRATWSWLQARQDTYLCQLAARVAFETWLYRHLDAPSSTRDEVWHTMQLTFGPPDSPDEAPWSADHTFFLRPFYSLDYALATLLTRHLLTRQDPCQDLLQLLRAPTQPTWSAWCRRLAIPPAPWLDD